jgi:hypothetical protein
MAEQHLVQFGPPHLPGVGHGPVPGVAELQERRLAVLLRHELDAPLGHAHALDLLAHAQGVEQRAVGRQQRFADVEARVVLLLQHHHAPPLARQQGGHGAARGPAADHQDIAVIGRGAVRGGHGVVGAREGGNYRGHEPVITSPEGELPRFEGAA